MLYAQIKDGIICNIVVLEDESILSQLSYGYDAVIEVSSDPGSPGIGWSWDGQIFSAPATVAPIETDAGPLH